MFGLVHHFVATETWRFRKWVDTKWRQTYAVFVSASVSCPVVHIGFCNNVPAWLMTFSWLLTCHTTISIYFFCPFVLNCAIHVLFKLHLLHLKRPCRQDRNQTWSIFMDELMVQEEHMMLMKFKSCFALGVCNPPEWVDNFKYQSDPSGFAHSSTRKPSPPSLFSPSLCEIYIWTIFWVPGWI